MSSGDHLSGLGTIDGSARIITREELCADLKFAREEGEAQVRAEMRPLVEAAENLLVAIDSDLGFFEAVAALRKAVEVIRG